jgi:hypothetical protein
MNTPARLPPRARFLAWYDARGYTELARQVLYDYRTRAEAENAR